MRTYESFLALIAELDCDNQKIQRIRLQNIRAWERIQNGANDPVDWGGLAYTIHSLYGLSENYFLRISKYFENDLPTNHWHRKLVEKMALDIPGLRPPLFTSPQEKIDVLEILRFRHHIRNLYGEDLNPVKTTEIQSIVERFYSTFPVMHAGFREKLLAIAKCLSTK